MKVLASIIFLFYAVGAFAQIQFQPDTLTYNDRISGDIDTVDIANSSYSSVFDGGIPFARPGRSASMDLMQTFKGRQFQQSQDFGTLRFSALPHLGFAYSFGGQGSQFLHATYAQAFSEKMLLNIDYKKSNGNGFIRSSSFGLNDLRMQLQRSAKRYSFSLNAGYVKNLVNHPGGITTDTLIEDFGLEFSNVNKSAAVSDYQSGRAQLTNYLNFLSDSTSQLGILTYHDFVIKNRLYTENDFVASIYSITNIDSNSTRDQFNVPSIENGAGLYYSSPKLFISGHFNHVYWNYQNLGSYIDSTELNVRSSFKFQLKGLSLMNKFYYNLLGRFNEWSNFTSISYRKDKFHLAANTRLTNLAPEVMTRDYFGNHMNVDFTSIAKQSVNRIDAFANYNLVDSMLNVSLFGNYTTVKGAYVYADSTFLNDTLADYNFSSLGARIKLDLKPFHLITSFTFNKDKDNYMPAAQLYTRAYLKGRLFEAKKLQAAIGVDFTYTSSYKMRMYVPMIDMYDYFNSGGLNNNLTDLHAFVSLGIDEFKFYFRFENIGYFWNDKTTEVKVGYPISSPRLRVGLTWDFFN